MNLVYRLRFHCHILVAQKNHILELLDQVDRFRLVLCHLILRILVVQMHLLVQVLPKICQIKMLMNRDCHHQVYLYVIITELMEIIFFDYDLGYYRIHNRQHHRFHCNLHNRCPTIDFVLGPFHWNWLI